MVYCYLDKQCGVSYRAICCALLHDNGSVEYHISNQINTMWKFREGSLDCEAFVFPEDADLSRFQEYAEDIKDCYGYYEELMEPDEEVPFDEFRHPNFPTDILTVVMGPNKEGERMWLREIKRLNDGTVKAKLIDEPFNDEAGVHEGDVVTVVPMDMGRFGIMPFAILPWMEDLEGLRG